MMSILRSLIIIACLVLVWQIIIWLSNVPHFILPAPARVAEAWWVHHATILGHAGVTLLEIALGLLFGALLGALSALALAYFRPARRWLLPVLVASRVRPGAYSGVVAGLWHRLQSGDGDADYLFSRRHQFL